MLNKMRDENHNKKYRLEEGLFDNIENQMREQGEQLKEGKISEGKIQEMELSIEEIDVGSDD